MAVDSPNREKRPLVKSSAGHFDSVADLIDVSRPVEVYRNLHKKCWSVRQRGKVLLHTDYITLKDCNFVVNEKGRQKVLETKRKNVHAFIRGYLIHPSKTAFHKEGVEFTVITYNPYHNDNFLSNGEDTESADFVDMAYGMDILANNAR